LRDLWLGWVDLLLPPTCAGCGGAADDALCAACAARLPRIPAGRCALCQERDAPASRRCPVCARRRGPLAACVAGCWFEGDAADWIRAFKYPGRTHALGGDARARLRALALETLARAPAAEPGQVVPIPLHPRKLRERGFNPSLTLARQLARARGLPLRPGLLARVRDTESQTGLARAARRRNVRGAFRAARRIRGHVWLVDDVVTTGATLAEAARALHRAGARSVVGLCAARTPSPAPVPATPRSSRR
jgi:ComF family protein